MYLLSHKLGCRCQPSIRRGVRQLCSSKDDSQKWSRFEALASELLQQEETKPLIVKMFGGEFALRNHLTPKEKLSANLPPNFFAASSAEVLWTQWGLERPKMKKYENLDKVKTALRRLQKDVTRIQSIAENAESMNLVANVHDQKFKAMLGLGGESFGTLLLHTQGDPDEIFAVGCICCMVLGASSGISTFEIRSTGVLVEAMDTFIANTQGERKKPIEDAVRLACQQLKVKTALAQEADLTKLRQLKGEVFSMQVTLSSFKPAVHSS